VDEFHPRPFGLLWPEDVPRSASNVPDDFNRNGMSSSVMGGSLMFGLPTFAPRASLLPIDELALVSGIIDL
jgi:hypothetical protein